MNKVDWSDWDNAIFELSEERPPIFNKCICPTSSGCNCGAIDLEREEQRRIVEEAEEANRRDLNKGVPFEERNRKYGHIIKSV